MKPVLAGFASVLLVAALASALPVDLGDATITGAAPPEASTVPEKLAPAIKALSEGDAESALKTARVFVREQPGSAIGHEILGTAARARRQWKEAESALREALRLEPGRPRAMVELGAVAIEQNDLGRAETILREAVERAPQMSAARRNLAIVHYQRGRIDQAVAEFEQSLRLAEGKDPAALYFLALIHHDRGQLAPAEQRLAEAARVRPDFLPAQLLLGLVKVELRKPREAEPLLRKVIARDAGSLQARLGLAVVTRMQGDLATARADLQQIVRDKPDWQLARVQLTQTLLMQGQTEAALQELTRGERLSPAPALFQVQAGRLLLAHGQVHRARAKARAALATPSAARPARALLAQAYAVKGQLDLAESTLKAAVAADPGDVSAHLHLGRLAVAQHRPKDAIGHFARVQRLRPEASEPVALLAEAHVAAGQAQQAVVAADKLVVLRRGAPDAHVFAGGIHERLGRAKEAERAYRRALEREPNHVAASRALASIDARAGRTANAIRRLEDAASAHPSTVEPLLDAAALHARGGNRPAAIAVYRKVIEREPDHPVGLSNLALLLADEPKSIDEALNLADRAHRRAPRNAAVADALGWIHFLKGDLERARALIAPAVSAAPNSPTFRYHLGMVLAKQGRTAEARRELERVASASATGIPEVEAAKRMLPSLR